MSAKFTVPRQKARYSPLLVTLHFLSQLVDEVAGTITWASQPSQQHFSKRRIPNFRPSATRLSLNLCEGPLPRLGFQSSQALFKNNTPVSERLNPPRGAADPPSRIRVLYAGSCAKMAQAVAFLLEGCTVAARRIPKPPSSPSTSSLPKEPISLFLFLFPLL